MVNHDSNPSSVPLMIAAGCGPHRKPELLRVSAATSKIFFDCFAGTRRRPAVANSMIDVDAHSF